MNDLVDEYLRADFFSSSERDKILEEIITFLMKDFQVNRETATKIWTKYIVGLTKDKIISKYESVKELINMIKDMNNKLMDENFIELTAKYVNAENHYEEMLAEKEIISYIETDLSVGINTARLIWSYMYDNCIIGNPPFGEIMEFSKCYDDIANIVMSVLSGN